MEDAQDIVVNKLLSSVEEEEEEEEDDDEIVKLPPGFRFHPTDEEIISCYLTEKVMNSYFTSPAIGEADLNKCEPWDLPKKAKKKMGSEKEWYLFCQRDRKYPTGIRTNRATESGYWKATGKDKEIYKSLTKGIRTERCLVGMKKTLVFYKGRAPKGDKTNWVMHEFRLEPTPPHHHFSLPNFAKDEWVVCRVFHKNNNSSIKKALPVAPSSSGLGLPMTNINNSSFGVDTDNHDDHVLDCSTPSSLSLPPLIDLSTAAAPSSSNNYNMTNFIFSSAYNNSNNNVQQQRHRPDEELLKGIVSRSTPFTGGTAASSTVHHHHGGYYLNYISISPNNNNDQQYQINSHQYHDQPLKQQLVNSAAADSSTMPNNNNYANYLLYHRQEAPNSSSFCSSSFDYDDQQVELAVDQAHELSGNYGNINNNDKDQSMVSLTSQDTGVSTDVINNKSTVTDISSNHKQLHDHHINNTHNMLLPDQSPIPIPNIPDTTTTTVTPAPSYQEDDHFDIISGRPNSSSISPIIISDLDHFWDYD